MFSGRLNEQTSRQKFEYDEYKFQEQTSLKAMDNRRVYKKQSFKSKDKNLLSKVKRFFLSSLWNQQNPESAVVVDSEPNKESTPSSNTAQHQPKVNQAPTGNFVAPSTPNQVYSNRDSGSLNTDEGEKTPNVLLSEFFKRKGDQPLTAVEYEGVMSLISQSHKKPNDGIRSPIMPGTFTSYETPIPGSGSKKVKPNSNLIESTPSQQRTLRHASSSKESSPRVFATPEYRPVYHNITSSSKRGDVPSVKRVYQFSGLPSPYRTRIKAPITSPHKRIKQGSNYSTLILSTERSKSTKPMNKAASTLLSVLDDSKKNNNYILQFSNPYIGTSSVSKRHGGNLTADAINSTIIFDQSTDLPDTISNNSSVTTPAAETGSVNNIETTNFESNDRLSSIAKDNEPRNSDKDAIFGSTADLKSTTQTNTNISSSSSHNMANNSGLKNIIAANINSGSTSAANSASSEATESSSSNGTENNNTEIKPSPSFGFSNNQPKFSGLSSTANSNPVNQQKQLPTDSGVDKKTKGLANLFGENASLFGGERNVNTEDKLRESSTAPNNIFSGSFTNKNEVNNNNHGTKDLANGFAKLASTGPELFQFPKVEVEKVNLDERRVDGLKHLFTFNA